MELIEFIESYRKIDDGDYQWNDNHGVLIRCKDCKHKHIKDNVWTCPFGLPAGFDFYCGYGERKPE